ncbi:centromere protein X isoform X1 [Coturnix japonica]|uniref:centromere protein X isoform X1 n=1 Tax=Coturnix japonica TaxID=93934 RepID=UPI00077729B2|nr:centromere protein X isoform X1 [Coturnix japonica]
MAAGRYRPSPRAALPTRSRRAEPRPACGPEVEAGGAMEEREGGFRKDTVERLLRLHFRDGRTRVNGDALLLMAELLKVFVREAAARAVRQAQGEELEKVDIEHVEKVLPQLRRGEAELTWQKILT